MSNNYINYLMILYANEKPQLDIIYDLSQWRIVFRSLRVVIVRRFLDYILIAVTYNSLVALSALS